MRKVVVFVIISLLFLGCDNDTVDDNQNQENNSMAIPPLYGIWNEENSLIQGSGYTETFIFVPGNRNNDYKTSYTYKYIGTSKDVEYNGLVDWSISRPTMLLTNFDNQTVALIYVFEDDNKLFLYSLNDSEMKVFIKVTN